MWLITGAPINIAAAPDDFSDRPVTGIFAPQIPTALNVFNGVDASGTWTLIVDDDLVGFTGTLQQWSLKITY